MVVLEKIIWISIILIIILSVKDKIKLALPLLLVIAGLILSLTQLVPSVDMSPEMIFMWYCLPYYSMQPGTLPFRISKRRSGKFQSWP